MKKPILNTLVEDVIIKSLVSSGKTAKELYEEVSKMNPISLQGLYKSLRSLLAREVLIKVNNEYLINNIWVEKVINLLNQKKKYELQEGESIVYSFHSIDQIDNFWKHIQHEFSFIENAKTVLYYAPHQFWWIIPARRSSEQEFYKAFEKKKKRACLLIGNTTDLDLKTKSEIQNIFVSVHCEKVSKFKKTDSLTVAGDYIVSTHISEKKFNKIDSVYSKKIPILEKEKQLAEELSRPFDVKVTITRNKQVVDQYRELFSKYFFID